MKKHFIILLLSTSLLSACSFVADYEKPQMEALPQSFTQQDMVALDAHWWQNFRSDELNDLMAQALKNNTDLKAAFHRVEQARANLRIARADLFPSLDGTASASSQNNNHQNNQSWSAGATASYELDLFGKNRAASLGAFETEKATAFERDALQVSLMAEVANAYFATLATKEQFSIAEQNVQTANELLLILNAQYDVGRTSALELAQQRTILADGEATLASSKQAYEEASNALTTLLAKPPHTVEIKAKNLQAITLPEIKAVLPSDLLSRRPDIAQQEALLKAAGANVAVAKSAFFPSLDISASWTRAAAGFGDPSYSVAQLLSSVTTPIFEGGHITGGVKLAEAQQRELIEDYRGTIFQAYEEAANSLSYLNTSKTRDAALQAASSHAEQAYLIAKMRYESGSIDFQTLLDVERSHLSAESSAVEGRLNQLNAAVSMYKTLGGGWQNTPFEETTKKAQEKVAPPVPLDNKQQ